VGTEEEEAAVDETADEEAQQGEVDGAPSLEPVDPDAPPKRPAWADTPRTVRKSLMAGNRKAPLFGFHFEGGAVTEQGVQINFLSQFLESFRKVFEPLQVLTTGRMPEGNNLPQTSAADPMVNALSATASVTIFFALNPEEIEQEEKKRDDLASLLSVRATGHLGALLDVTPDGDVVSSMSPFGRRISRSYGQMAKLLGDYEVKTDWWSDNYGSGEIELSAPEASAIADDLLNKPTTERRTFKLRGFMWEAATGKAGRRFVRIDDGERSVKASYDIPLTSQVRDALSHRVSVRLRETAYFRPFDDKPNDKPNKREFELVKINEIGDSAGALAEAEQLQLDGT
jgi:hypothetical protein